MKQKHRRNNFRILCCDVILEAFLEYINDDFVKSRSEVDPSKVFNQSFWTQGRFVSLDGIDKYGNIIYQITQPGTFPSYDHHIISIATHYNDYKPYHKKWLKSIERNSVIGNILD